MKLGKVLREFEEPLEDDAALPGMAVPSKEREPVAVPA